MSLKWTGSQGETGILRKSESKEKKEELFVFGYSCKLFRDDDKALHVDQGKHLIPWMGDETLKIDRYDARGALHDLSALEAPPGGFDWRVELTRAELDVEQLCDEERYRALHTDEDEEEMYKEEELKRLHKAGYGQVGFNYEAKPEATPEAPPTEVEEPFEAPQALIDLLPPSVVLPETQKQNAIIEKTAKFIAYQGAQMEILIKAKQGDNPQFKFLNKDNPLHQYYTAFIGLVKSGKWPEKKVEAVEEKHDVNEEYLHPSLASTIIESAPSIPSIHYKPSADCDYTLLISKMRGEATLDETYAPELAPGEVAPPGTEPLPPRAKAEISRAPVMYNSSDYQAMSNPVYQQQYAAYYQQYMQQQAQAQAQAQTQVQPPAAPAKKPTITPTKSTGLSLMKNYNTDSDSDVSDFDDSSSSDSKGKPIIITPPEEVKSVIDKMAGYVARNGDEFEEIVRAKNDPRFTFLEPENIYHPYYKKLMQEKRGVDVNGRDKNADKPKNDKAPVSFSIKKLKEPDPILPKPALPYESSSEDEEAKQSEKSEEPPKEIPKSNIPPILLTNNMPPVVVYKMEGTQVNNLPVVKTIETKIANNVPKLIIPEIKPIIEPIKIEENPVVVPERVQLKAEESKKERTPEKKDFERSKDKEKSPRKDKRKHERKKGYRSKSEHREIKRSSDRDKERERKKEKESERERERKRRKYKDELENEIISLEDNSDDMIDLTGDQSDSKVECDTEVERAKQQERRKRAAEFLKKVGVDPAAAALPTSSLASAMVDTLESLRKKKSEEEEKRRRREKRHRRERREYGDESERYRKSKRKKRSSDEDESENDVSKKKKRKKDKKTSKNKKKKRRESDAEEDLPMNIDLANTLKELRSASPTKELELQTADDVPSLPRQESSEEEEGRRKKKKKDREYSEGEWSSDSDEDSVSTADVE